MSCNLILSLQMTRDSNEHYELQSTTYFIFQFEKNCLIMQKYLSGDSEKLCLARIDETRNFNLKFNFFAIMFAHI